jgi:hypothetical protein
MVDSDTVLSDSILLVRNTIRDNVIDPISATRKSDSNFVMTSYPQRPTQYPIITVRGIGMPSLTKLGARSSIYNALVPIEVRVWARNEKEKINLTEQWINVMRTNQLSGNDFVDSERLLDFAIVSSVPVDEEGKQGVKSQVTQANFTFLLGET